MSATLKNAFSNSEKSSKISEKLNSIHVAVDNDKIIRVE